MQEEILPLETFFSQLRFKMPLARTHFPSAPFVNRTSPHCTAKRRVLSEMTAVSPTRLPSETNKSRARISIFITTENKTRQRWDVRSVDALFVLVYRVGCRICSRVAAANVDSHTGRARERERELAHSMSRSTREMRAPRLFSRVDYRLSSVQIHFAKSESRKERNTRAYTMRQAFGRRSARFTLRARRARSSKMMQRSEQVCKVYH